jgi:diguanylate cyclase (GGDEF)-like protein
MTYGRTKMVLRHNPTPSTLPQTGAADSRASPFDLNAAREVRFLRSVNARLLRVLAALKAREAETRRLADRDGLTGLYNRRRMLELLESAISDAGLHGQRVGLLFIDLNGFKAVNDAYGHAAGDKLLITAATRISARVRTDDIVCRYGGDEFVVVLPSAPDPFAVSQVADAIRERISLPCWIDGHDPHVTAAIGQSLYPNDGRNAAQLLRRADEAMYRLKAWLPSPMLRLGDASSLSRRRNDKSKSRAGGAE